ncbi:MAG: phosphate acyltransferase PlsX [Spirochaetes bacterium]|nr:MAG: phosphate acyltransferase PlsX [Spirochaetota bacterium]
MIAVDVMSGERPPEQIIKGALRASEEFKVNIILVGDEKLIESILKKLKHTSYKRVKIEHSSEKIDMHEKPTVACKDKPDSSIMVATRLIGEGKARGLFSPGNTGATLVASLMNIGRIEGIYRPGMVTFVPTLNGASLLIDAGANPDCKPEYLAQFAFMGEVFAQKIQKKKKPSVGLLSIGQEKSKGNELTLKTYDILKDLDFNFVGNIEGYDIYNGDVDIIVCDGFVGNIVVKVTERVFKLTFEFVWQEIGYHLFQRLGFALAYPAVKKLTSKMDPREYGGAPLLGLKGNVVIGHGTSDDVAAYHGVRIANLLVENRFNEVLIKRLDNFGLRKMVA